MSNRLYNQSRNDRQTIKRNRESRNVVIEMVLTAIVIITLYAYWIHPWK